ncbi:hypothetical protein B0T25DRAFT_323397 [Lasiosphaeria hispida]|uniref:Box C/D snoRNA protein 1 n=1 Tax=Lasiosphaeria hispida TaxID=260671 RepID=A0AAJ0HA40_9PEZI|nr:hypothetical protein B0T25DRAFT_323397 [Lasiosphaeria hispida]
MSEPVLSELCTICHSELPKYKCPRCGVRTCSASCVQKHKARADCDGIRNPRAFVPISQLRTASGVDHDFNFISSIERARQRAENDLIEVRNLLSERELRPAEEDKQFRKVWYGDDLHHLPVTESDLRAKPGHHRGGGGAGPAVAADKFDKHVRRRVRALDIEAVSMPKGMARQKENRTSWNRRTFSINWQVEWLIHGVTGLGESPQHQPTRIMRKILEGVPLNGALVATIDWHRGQLDRQSREQAADSDESDNESDSPPKKKKRYNPNRRKKASSSAMQDQATTAWLPTDLTLQSSLTGAWGHTSPTACIHRTPAEDAEQFARWQFFLQHAGTPANRNTNALIPLAPTDSLAEALAGRTVVEFPTVYILPPAASPPEGFTVEAANRRPKRNMQEVAREGGDKEGGRPGKRQARGRDERNPNREHASRGGGKWEPRGRGGRGGRGRGRGRGANGDRFERMRGPVEDGEVNENGDEVMADVGGHEGGEEAYRSRGMIAFGTVGEVKEVVSKPTGGLVGYDSGDD